MLKTTFKILPILVLVLITTTATIQYSSAATVDCSIDPEDYGPLHLVCPVIRIVNVLLYSSGAVFVLMIVVSGYKYYVSLGDPKLAMGANLTFFWAIVGFIIIVGVFVILRIVVNLLGVDPTYGDANNIFDAITTGICKLVTGVTSSGGDIVTIPGC